jgi:signal peptidase II
MRLKSSVLLIIIILLVDQISKVYIKTNFLYGEAVEVFSWFKIFFIENEGMAWGAKIPGSYGKVILTVFRLVAIVGIGWWLWDSTRKKSPKLLLIAIALIFAGALGNILDSVFYGVLFGESKYDVIASFLPEAGGYAPLLKGKVVDMLYFPLYDGVLPSWVPIWGGEKFTFFEPVFNVADTAISTGFGILLVFHKKAFPKTKND